MQKILYIDMDGVIADFDTVMLRFDPQLESRARSDVLHDDRERRVDRICSNHPTIFEYLPLIEGAEDAVTELFERFEVFFLSTPMWDVPESYTGKRIWINKVFGVRARKKLILTHRKDLLLGDFLVDDRMKNGAENFRGERIHFGSEEYPGWDVVMAHLRRVC